MLTLFVVTTGEGWPGIRQNSMDTTVEDQGPSPFFRIEVALFYVAFFIVFPVSRFLTNQLLYAYILVLLCQHLRCLDYHYIPRLIVEFL